MSTTTATDTTPSKAHVIRTLAKSLREYRTASLLSPLFVIVEAVIEIAIPTVIAILIDKGISGKSMPDIWKYGGILIAWRGRVVVRGLPGPVGSRPSVPPVLPRTCAMTSSRRCSSSASRTSTVFRRARSSPGSRPT